MKKIILFTLLASMILFCTACKKQQENLENISETMATTKITETIATQSEIITENTIHSELNSESKASTNSETSATSITNMITTRSLSSETTALSIATTDPTESALQLEMQEALQNAIDEEERQAIQDVQETRETAIYYKDPTLDFDNNNFSNLAFMETASFPKIRTNNGYNVHTYFFEAKSMSGNNLLQMQKMANYFADVQINIEKINASAETLEDSEYLIYNSDSLYL
ncbi:MAG: hypothetical protein K2K06_10740, partial [Oscillospiraceae bacterium]|nr:hypothetical protein [Oscillospiraceae bacterium]